MRWPPRRSACGGMGPRRTGNGDGGFAVAAGRRPARAHTVAADIGGCYY